MIRVEQGTAVVKIGECVNQLDFQQNICKGDAVFIPAGTWHNVVNIGRIGLEVCWERKSELGENQIIITQLKSPEAYHQ